MRKSNPIPILMSVMVFALMLVACVGPGDPESVDSIVRAEGLYDRDVNGGMTAVEAKDLGDSLTARFADATKPADLPEGASAEDKVVHDATIAAWEAKVDVFRTDVFKLIIDELSVTVANDFFAAALRYELSKFPKGDAPDVKTDDGSADDP